jgi:Ca-activated chloride channel family protein
MKYPLLALLLLVILSPLLVLGQSGRRKPPEPNPKPQTSKPQTTQPAKIEETNEDVNESRLGPDGETVEGDVIRFNTSLVTVPVSVLDRSGRFIPTMRRSDFHLFENGVEQKIAYFATSDQPFTVILLLDTSGSTQFRLDDIQDAAITFVSKLKANDSVMVISFDDRIRVLTKPTTDRDLIERGIRKSSTGGGTRLYDTVEEVFQKHLPRISGRKAVILFTDGVDTTSHNATYESTLRDAEESDAPIYTLDYDTSGLTSGGAGGVWGQGAPTLPSRGGVIFGTPIPGRGGSMPNPGDYRRAVEYLRALSNYTGGRFYSADTLVGIGQAFTWIAEELSRQYTLGYYPQVAGRAGERRSIKVRIEIPEYVVRARESYIYPDKKPTLSPEKSGEKKQYVATR